MAYEISSAELGFTNHTIYRYDRNLCTSNKRSGGGVLIGVRSDYSSYEIKLTENTIEQLYVCVNFGHGSCILGCVYIPPHSPQEVYAAHCSTLEDMQLRFPDRHMFIAGDYNLPTVHCAGDCLEDIDLDQPPGVRMVLGAASFLGLNQINKTLNNNGRRLDLVFTNFISASAQKTDDHLIEPDSHHPPLRCLTEVVTPAMQGVNVSQQYNFCRGDYINMCEYLLSVNWCQLNFLSLDRAVEVFYGIMREAIAGFVPLNRCDAAGRFPKWFSPELRDLVREKRRAHAKYKSTLSNADYRVFADLRCRCKRLSDLSHRNYLKKIQDNIVHDPKTFWKYVNSLRGDNSLPCNMTYDGKSSDNTCDIANCFADFFSSVYDTHSFSGRANIECNFSADLFNLRVSSEELEKKLKGIDCNKGSGPDGVPPLLLRACSGPLSLPLLILFNKSLATGEFPDYWKTGHIVPVFKNQGDKRDISKYRPITILSTIPKLFESLVLDLVTPAFKNLIISQQHGFVRGRSTTTNLLLYQDYINHSLNQGRQVDSIYCDLSKAFDKVCHDLLIYKLDKMGVGGTLLPWLESYLTGRRLRVRVNNDYSREFIPHSGVPQGSHIGPLLFVLFINDIKSSLDGVDFLLFADDIKIFKTIKTLEDCGRVQDSIDSFSTWVDDNFLKLNIEKCNIVRFHRNTSPIIFDYKLNMSPLTTASIIKDLGVYFDNRMTFGFHIEKIAREASSLLGFICRNTRSFSNTSALKSLYCSLVRSRLEFNSTIWSPYYAAQSNCLQSVESKFIRYVKYKNRRVDMSSSQVLAMLNMRPLDDRRIISDLITLFKIMNCFDCPELLGLIDIRVPCHKTRNSDTFHLDTYSYNYSQNAPLTRLHRLGNTYGGQVDIFHTSIEKIRDVRLR